MKLWGGRFQEETDGRMDDFHSSIHFDRRLYREDIAGSIAHATMLGECGIISKEEAEAICQGLEEILADIEAGKVEFDPAAEDIHMNIEKLLTEQIGDPGRKLHTGRSRNDQVALDLRMYLKREIEALQELLTELQRALLEQAERNQDVVMPGYTHLQRAQPVLFAHHMLAYFEMFQRDYERLSDCYKRTDVLPLGAGALAGTTFPIDRERVAELLGFSQIAQNSLDAVSDRDFAVEFLAAASLIMVHLSRLGEEIVIWSSQEFGFVELSDSFSTGSSIMPQKKNPDVAELVRGKTGRVFGDLVALLTVLKGLPLAYNKDMQEDKESVFDAVDTLKGCLEIMAPMISTMKLRPETTRKAAGGFALATDLADFLAKRGLPFRQAHEVLGKLVYHCIQNGKQLEELSLEELASFSPLFDGEALGLLSPEASVELRDHLGGTAPRQVAKQLARAQKILAGRQEKQQ
ncbi:MAG: argininosuccinate lyase [Firmicutes bacterium]|nr:argininosuccinate lyase [Bacillota bacterium]